MITCEVLESATLARCPDEAWTIVPLPSPDRILRDGIVVCERHAAHLTPVGEIR